MEECGIQGRNKGGEIIAAILKKGLGCQSKDLKSSFMQREIILKYG